MYLLIFLTHLQVLKVKVYLTSEHAGLGELLCGTHPAFGVPFIWFTEHMAGGVGQEADSCG